MLEDPNPIRVYTRLTVHETPAALYSELERVFESKGEQATRWVVLTTADGVEVTFFEPTAAAPADAAAGAHAGLAAAAA